MDLLAFEHDRPFVLEALRRGEIDYLEHVGEAVEGDFFRQLIDRQVLQRLADCYPTPRKKEEVPIWLYLASQISLKLHGRKVIMPSRAFCARVVSSTPWDRNSEVAKPRIRKPEM